MAKQNEITARLAELDKVSKELGLGIQITEETKRKYHSEAFRISISLLEQCMLINEYEEKRLIAKQMKSELKL